MKKHFRVCIFSIIAAAMIAAATPSSAAIAAEGLEESKASAVAWLKDKLAQNCPMQTFETTDPLLSTASYTYENAVCALALISEGEYEDAAKILDALTAGMEKDVEFHNRFRNAYMAGKASDLPGYWDDAKGEWIQDAYMVGSSTKSNAAAALALLIYYKTEAKESYLNAAVTALDWIIDNCQDDSPGFTAGYTGWPNAGAATVFTYKSTADNCWMLAASRRLGELTGWKKYIEAASSASLFLTQNMFSEGDSRYFQGTTEDGVTPATNLLLTEAQALPALCLYDGSGMDNMERCMTTDGGYSYDNSDTDGLWLEGTAIAAQALQKTGHESAASAAFEAMKNCQLPSGGFPQASIEVLQTGELDHVITDLPSAGPAAWFIMSCNDWNPLV